MRKITKRWIKSGMRRCRDPIGKQRLPEQKTGVQSGSENASLARRIGLNR